MFCSKCGSAVDNNANFCGSCGTSIAVSAEAQSIETDYLTSKPPITNKSKKNSIIWSMASIAGLLLFIFMIYQAKIEVPVAQTEDKLNAENNHVVTGENVFVGENVYIGGKLVEKAEPNKKYAGVSQKEYEDKVDNAGTQSSLDGSKYNKQQFEMVASCVGYWSSLTSRGVVSSEIIKPEIGKKFIALGYMDLLGAVKKCGNSSLNECRPKLTTDEYNFSLEFGVRKMTADRKTVDQARVEGAFICSDPANLLN